MTKEVAIAVTFIIFLLLFTVVGTYSATRKQNTTTDYLLASRNVNPWLTALSAMATGQSGLLFIGQVGFAYKIGISSLWLTLGWVIGDYLAWWFVFKRLRKLSEETGSDTVSSFLSQNTAIAMMVTGIATALIWNLGFHFSGAMYEVLPGMAAGIAVYGLAQFSKLVQKYLTITP